MSFQITALELLQKMIFELILCLKCSNSKYIVDAILNAIVLQYSRTYLSKFQSKVITKETF